jgi:hypothetical protein
MTTSKSSRPTDNRGLLSVFLLASLGWLLFEVVHPDGPPSWPNSIAVGLMVGTLFGHVSLSATWCALGPLSLVNRLPMAFAWLAIMVILWGFKLALGPSSQSLSDLIELGLAMLTQWLLIQAPMWLLVWLYRVRIDHSDRDEATSRSDDMQFGIRQLLILTALVAVVLGVGRLALGGLQSELSGDSSIGMIALLVVSNALIGLPLVAAVLLRRKTLLAVTASIGLATFVTGLELPLLWLIEQQALDGYTYLMLCGMNFVQCLWILTAAFILRLAGYGLSSRRQAPAAS